MNETRKEPLPTLPTEYIGAELYHHDSDGFYVVTGVCYLEATTQPALVYQSLRRPEQIWAREFGQCIDGRFSIVMHKHRPREQALEARNAELEASLRDAVSGLRNGLELWSDCPNARATIDRLENTLNKQEGE